MTSASINEHGIARAYQMRHWETSVCRYARGPLPALAWMKRVCFGLFSTKTARGFIENGSQKSALTQHVQEEAPTSAPAEAGPPREYAENFAGFANSALPMLVGPGTDWSAGGLG